MKHEHEIEVKLVVNNLADARRRLRVLGFRQAKGRYLESNYLFDFPDRRLRRARCLLRVRFAGHQPVVTFKGTPLASAHYKVRREIETRVEDGDRFRQLFRALGMKETFRYEKYRTLYVPAGQPRGQSSPHVVLDETPIGNYFELEGTRRWIDQVATHLGYRRRDYITASYARLYFHWCAALRREPGHMVFSHRKSASRSARP